jgi:trehalose/maltose hydrolase-like predicted phosphorylase
VNIDDENGLALAVQHSIYQLIIYAPKVENLSISARGLSGQTYKGAVFWDTEMFMIPYYLRTDPETAKRLIRYRINGLSGAMLKAKEYGYSGAFYAWESQENGYDACSDFNVVDVFTGRAVRTYFKDKQIHISADIAVCLYDVYRQTGDLSLLTDGGAEMLIQCALFYYYRAYYNHIKDRFELLDVMGPDEYHDGVNNNAYTNYMAHETASVTLKALATLKKRSPEHYKALMEAHENDIKCISKFRSKIYLPTPDEKGIIEQFDGYFKLEDVLPDQVRARLVHPSEYWGGSNGVATATRVIKQADVVALMCVLPHRFSAQVKRANYSFYLPYTEHGSSLSASMYARCACMVGLQDESYEWFTQTATCDLSGNSKQFAGKLYIGGTHPASCGGTWLTLYEGFAKNAPRLPKQVKSLSISTVKGTKVYGKND